MEDGRRMFQVFAARMFEQRVLQAYREKVNKIKYLLNLYIINLLTFNNVGRSRASTSTFT